MVDVLGVNARPRTSHVSPVRALSSNIQLACGVALMIVGWLDLLLLWIPQRLGNPSWEFGAVSAHLDGMPLATIGLALVAVGLATSRSRWVLRSFALWSLIVTLMLVTLMAIYWLTVPLALEQVESGAQLALRKSIVKTNLFAAVYIPFYVWLCWQFWRKSLAFAGSPHDAAVVGSEAEV